MQPSRSSNKIPQERLVLYDFSLLSLPRFAHLRMEVHGGFLTEPFANEFAFSGMVRDMFARCYDVENKLQKNDLYFEEYPHFIYALMESYAAQIKQSYRNDPRAGIRLMSDWLLKTREIIEEQYQALPTLYLASDIAAKKDLQKCQSKDTWPVKLNVYSLLYRYFHYRIENLLPKMPDSLANLIPYNMWIGEYDELKAEYTGKFGLEFRQRAIVNVEDNKKRFFEVLVEQCMTFCRQMTSDNPMMSYDEIYRHCDEPMTTLIHSYFQDYIARLQANSDIASDIDAAIINWFVSLLTGIYETYAANQRKVLSKCGRTPAVDVASMRFYLDICERNVLEIAHEYFIDTETIPLVSEIKIRESYVKPEDLKTIHHKTIDYKTLYNEWVDVAFINVTLEEFTYAIDQANFSSMMIQAKNAGAHAGYIGSIKFIMKCLRNHLDAKWYAIACKSINETVDSINKLNDGTRRIQNTNIKILSSCIK